MIFSCRSKSKVRKKLILFLCLIVIATIWYFEKSKSIPQYGAVFYEMGLNCEDECGKNKQLQYFQRAVRYNPKLSEINNNKLSDAHYRSALIYEERGDHAKSLDSLIRAIGLNQSNALAYYRIGLHYFKEGAYEYNNRHPEKP